MGGGGVALLEKLWGSLFTTTEQGQFKKPKSAQFQLVASPSWGATETDGRLLKNDALAFGQTLNLTIKKQRAPKEEEYEGKYRLSNL